MIAEISQRILHGFGMPVEWALSIVFAIYKGSVISVTPVAIDDKEVS